MDGTPSALRPEDPEEMRRSGYAVVDAIVERWAGLAQDRPWQGCQHDATPATLRGDAPESGGQLDDLIATALNDVLPLAGRIDHPRFLAFIPSSPTWASVLGTFLSTGYNIFQGTWLESSGPSQIEVTVTGWIREWMGYPKEAGGLFTSGGSAANLIGLVAAREAAGNPPRGAVYVSEQAHSSAVRAARIAGLSDDRVRRVGVDARFRLDPRDLQERIRADRDAGLEPFCVIATAGATNTGAIDPLAAIADVAQEARIWLHVDGAYGGFAVLDEGGCKQLEGIERADTITLDPHKWLFQPYETGCLMARDVRKLEDAFRIMPEYLQDAEWGPGNVNFCDRGLQLTRSFRALRVWLSVQRYGLAAHRAEIGRAIALAERAEARIRDEPELELLSAASLSIVCFRYVGSGADDVEDEALDELNEAIQAEAIRSGQAMMSSTRLHGRFALRFCILNAHTQWEDIDLVLDGLLEAGRALSRH